MAGFRGREPDHHNNPFALVWCFTFHPAVCSFQRKSVAFLQISAQKRRLIIRGQGLDF